MFLMNFLSSCRLSLVLLERSSVTVTWERPRALEFFKTSSLSLNVSNVTRAGRQP